MSEAPRPGELALHPLMLMAMELCRPLPADSSCGFTLEIFSPSGHAVWQRTSEELCVRYLEQLTESLGLALQGTASQDSIYGLHAAKSVQKPDWPTWQLLQNAKENSISQS